MQGDRIKIRVQKMEYFVIGGNFKDLLAVVKNLPNRRFVGDQKVWLVDASVDMIRGQIENSGYLLEGGTPAPEDATAAKPAHGQIKIETASFRAVVTGAPFSELLEAIKALPDRRFDGDSKRWTLTGSMMELKNYFDQKNIQMEQIEAIAEPPAQPAAPTLPPQPLFPPDVPPPTDEFSDFWEDESDDFADVGFAEPTPSAPEPLAPPSPASARPATPGGTARRDQIRVIVGNRQLSIVGGSFQEMLAAVKDIPGRRFDGETKRWLLPDDVESVQQHLNAKGFLLEE